MIWEAEADVAKGQDDEAAHKLLGLTVIAFAPVVGTRLSTSQANLATRRNTLNVTHK